MNMKLNYGTIVSGNLDSSVEYQAYPFMCDLEQGKWDKRLSNENVQNINTV